MKMISRNLVYCAEKSLLIFKIKSFTLWTPKSKKISQIIFFGAWLQHLFVMRVIGF